MPTIAVGAEQTFNLTDTQWVSVACPLQGSVASVVAASGFVGAPYEVSKVAYETRAFGPYGRAVSLTVRGVTGTVDATLMEGSRSAAQTQAGTSTAAATTSGASNIATAAASFFESDPSGAGGGGTGRTTYLKVEAEAPFTRFRVLLRGSEASASDGYVASGSVTEVAGTDSVANVCVPIVGGTQYNAVRSNAQPYGFLQANFSAAGGVLPAAGLQPDDPGQKTPAMIFSDWIYAASVPPTSGTRPFALVRVAKATGSNGTSTFPNPTKSGQWAAAKAANLPFARVNWGTSATGNGVTTPTLLPGAVAQGAEFWIGVEFDYGTTDGSVMPVKNVLAQGDSLTAAGGYQQYGWDGWVTRAALSASTPTRPVGVLNGGLSGCKAITSLAQTIDLLAKGLRPHVVTIPNFSVNDVGFSGLSALTSRHTVASKTMVMEAIRQCRLIGATPILWTTYHIKSTTNPSTPYTLLAEQNSWALALGAKLGIQVLDVAAGWDVATMLGADSIHPTPAGIAYMQSLLQPLLSA